MRRVQIEPRQPSRSRYHRVFTAEGHRGPQRGKGRRTISQTPLRSSVLSAVNNRPDRRVGRPRAGSGSGCTHLRWALPLSIVLIASVAHADVRSVGPEGIQAAIDGAADGDVIEVPPGVYHEHVRVDRRVTLRGRGGVLDGDGRGTVLRIAAARARVEGLTVTRSGIDIGAPDACIYVEESAQGAVLERNHLTRCAFGIWIHRTPGARVHANHVAGRSDLRAADRGNGIHLFDASHLTVTNNVVEGARDGIYVSATDDSLIANNRTDHQRYGIHYMYSQRNTLRGNHSSHNIGGIALMQSHDLVVEDNRAVDNERFGILFRDAQYCSIARNHLRENGQGMFFFSSTDNEIVDNELTHNDIGAKIWAGSLRNHIVGNRFIGNRQPIFFVGARDLTVGAGGHGNYWSDYIGWDQDGDGVGEVPYRVDSLTAVLIHRYPGAVLLLRSPALELLSELEQEMPILRVPTVVDPSPSIRSGR